MTLGTGGRPFRIVFLFPELKLWVDGWPELSQQRELFGDEPQRVLWQARFYDFNATSKKRLEKLRYMHRNPVKRGLVESPVQWRWSGYRHPLEAGAVRVNVGWGEISIRSGA